MRRLQDRKRDMRITRIGIGVTASRGILCPLEAFVYLVNGFECNVNFKICRPTFLKMGCPFLVQSIVTELICFQLKSKEVSYEFAYD